MKERQVCCAHYAAEYDCELGKEGTFWKQCQRCSSYEPKPNGKPARLDLRQKKREDARRKEEREY